MLFKGLREEFILESFFYTGDTLFNLIPIFMGIIFIIVIGSIILNAGKGISQWKKNEDSPRLSVHAMISSKRTNVSRHTHHHDDHMHSHSTSTTYYVTFQFESGDRSEFRISGKEYGQLAEGDLGTLTFQGTRYLGFERDFHSSQDTLRG